MPFLVGCDNDDPIRDMDEVRQVAWNYLSEESQSTVTTEWKQAYIEYEIYNDEETYAVRFNTTDDALLGPIVVFVRKSDLSVVGEGLRL